MVNKDKRFLTIVFSINCKYNLVKKQRKEEDCFRMFTFFKVLELL